jgi:hypothetical protein
MVEHDAPDDKHHGDHAEVAVHKHSPRDVVKGLVRAELLQHSRCTVERLWGKVSDRSGGRVDHLRAAKRRVEIAWDWVRGKASRVCKQLAYRNDTLSLTRKIRPEILRARNQTVEVRYQAVLERIAVAVVVMDTFVTLAKSNSVSKVICVLDWSYVY